MDLNETINVLKGYNEWRAGLDVPQPSPKIITEAIDVAINILSGLKQS